MLLALLKTLTKKRKNHSPICFSQKFISSSASRLGQTPVPQKLDFRRGKRTHRRHGPKCQRLKHRARLGLGRAVAAETWVGCAGPRIASLQQGDAAPPHWGRAHRGAACSDFYFFFSPGASISVHLQRPVPTSVHICMALTLPASQKGSPCSCRPVKKSSE